MLIPQLINCNVVVCYEEKEATFLFCALSFDAANLGYNTFYAKCVMVDHTLYMQKCVIESYIPTFNLATYSVRKIKNSYLSVHHSPVE